ncbi:MAG TPA: hypothetical protein VKE71_06110 [Candidatus Angelobacter sp.]|nr:hypothetical protein [Candidatus Angelobacter sp.]
MPEHHPRRVHRLRPRASRPLPSGALDDLRFIRETMERSSSFTAVPGWGIVAMGFTALLAAGVTTLSKGLSPRSWLAIWLLEAAVAVCIGLIATWEKAQRAGVPLTSGPARKFMFSFLPPAVAGGILTVVLFRLGLMRLLPGIWLLFYGAAVTSAGAFSVNVLPLMGAGFMLSGLAALFAPASFQTPLLAAAFGGLHIVFGYWIARRHCG